MLFMTHLIWLTDLCEKTDRRIKIFQSGASPSIFGGPAPLFVLWEKQKESFSFYKFIWNFRENSDIMKILAIKRKY